MKLKPSIVLFVGMFISLAVQAHEGQDIVEMNPQLKKIPDWPPLKYVGVPNDCNKCAKQYPLDSMRQLGETPYRCVHYEGKFGGKGWESGGGETKIYMLQLHPNSPKVWRVFPQHGYEGNAQPHLIAEFDLNGNLIFSKSARSPTGYSDRAADSKSTDCPGGRPYRGAGSAISLQNNMNTSATPEQQIVDTATQVLKGLIFK